MSNRKRSSHPRGAALIVTMVSMGMLTVIVAGAIVVTGRAREASASRRRGLQVQACAEAGKSRLVMAMASAPDPLKVEIGNTEALQATGSGAYDSLQLATGHVGSNATDNAVTLESADTLGAAGSIAESAETQTTPGGLFRTYRAVVRCRETPPASPPANYAPVESEVEFLFQLAPPVQ